MFEPVDRGCNGGSSTVSGTGGRGGGVIYLEVTDTLQNDGEISCNGEAGTGAGGGGSGGSILIDVHNVKVQHMINTRTGYKVLHSALLIWLSCFKGGLYATTVCIKRPFENLAVHPCCLPGTTAVRRESYTTIV